MPRSRTIRVVIADDHLLMRDTLAAAVGADPGLEVAGMAATVDESVEVTRAVGPDVVLVDTSLPGGGASTAATILRGLRAHPHVVALAAVRDDPMALEMLRSGACCFVVKERVATVLDAIRWAAQVSESGDHASHVVRLDRFRTARR